MRLTIVFCRWAFPRDWKNKTDISITFTVSKKHEKSEISVCEKGKRRRLCLGVRENTDRGSEVRRKATESQLYVYA